MTKKIFATGAGWTLMLDPTNPFHDYILSLVQKGKPSVLFLPTASGDNEEYIRNFYNCYTSDKCDPEVLRLFRREELELREFILQHDIIIVGGGNTANMIAVWRVHGVDEILKEAYEMGKILSGGSAGAVCWFDAGVTDSFGSTKLAPLTNCLGFLNGSLCPHYDVDALRKPAYHEFLKAGLLPSGYAIDDDAGIYFEDGVINAVVSSNTESKAYKLDVHDSSVNQEDISADIIIN